MAFITPSTRLPTSKQRKPATLNRRPTSTHTVRATATAPGPASVPRSKQSTTKPHKKTAAQIVDSRVGTRVEAHHWIVVKNNSMRIFERAAVAQADIARQVESRSKRGALHRWVLRQVADPISTSPDMSLQGNDAHYVVMEAFNREGTTVREEPVMRRWLSAVERVGPLMETVGIYSLRYENMFTSKMHDAKFDPHSNIIVTESVNVDMSSRSNWEKALALLQHTAETSVAARDCLEFCVLHAPGEKGFIKTIEVYQNLEALKRHMRGKDKAYAKQLEHYTTQGHRNRHTFKPVVFS